MEENIRSRDLEQMSLYDFLVYIIFMMYCCVEEEATSTGEGYIEIHLCEAINSP